MEQESLAVIFTWAKTKMNSKEEAEVGYKKTKVCNTNEVGVGPRRTIVVTHYVTENLIVGCASGDYKFSFRINFNGQKFEYDPESLEGGNTTVSNIENVLLWINTEPELRTDPADIQVNPNNEDNLVNENQNVADRIGKFRVVKDILENSRENFTEALNQGHFHQEFIDFCEALDLSCDS